jgi:hypothetical protein
LVAWEKLLPPHKDPAGNVCSSDDVEVCVDDWVVACGVGGVCVVADSRMKAVGEERGKSPAHVGGNG